MRHTWIMSLFMLGFGLAGFAPAQSPPNRPPQPPRQQSKPGRTNKIFKMFSSTSGEKVPEKTFIVTSGWLPKNDPDLAQDAGQNAALDKARDQVKDFLHDQKLGAEWTPSVPFIREHMLVDIREDEVANKDPKGELKEFSISDRYRAFEEAHTVEIKGKETENRRVWIKVAINPENWKLILKEVQQAEDDKRLNLSRARMVFLVKFLTGLVALFAILCGYLRLDEWSKGYYTKWLRLAAVGCVGAVTVFLWFLVAR